MTNKADHYAKFATILNRKDIFIVEDFSTTVREAYKVVANNGVTLLSVKKQTGMSLGTTPKQIVSIICETDGCTAGSVYDKSEKMPYDTACLVYRLLTRKYKEHQNYLAGFQKARA